MHPYRPTFIEVPIEVFRRAAEERCRQLLRPRAARTATTVVEVLAVWRALLADLFDERPEISVERVLGVPSSRVRLRFADGRVYSTEIEDKAVIAGRDNGGLAPIVARWLERIRAGTVAPVATELMREGKLK